MVADAWIFYNTAREYMCDGVMDLDADTFTQGLSTSTYVPNAETHSVLTDITNELVGNGYARHVHTMTWTRSTVTVTFDGDDATYTASGGAITARYAWIFDDSTTSPVDALLSYSLLDNTPADVSVADGNTLTVAFHASGHHTLTGGT